jgi:hypothetical protein
VLGAFSIQTQLATPLKGKFWPLAERPLMSAFDPLRTLELLACYAQRAEARMMKRLIAHFQNHVRQARSVLKWLARGRNA